MGKHAKYASGAEYYVMDIPFVLRTDDELYTEAKAIAERTGRSIDDVIFDACVGLHALLRKNISRG